MPLGTKDKQSTIASFSACLTGKDDDDDDDYDENNFKVLVFMLSKTCASVSYLIQGFLATYSSLHNLCTPQ